MKKILAILICIFVPVSVHAVNVSTSISCPKKSMTLGEEQVCTIYANSNDVIIGFTGKLSVSGGLALSSVSANSKSWQGAYNGNLFDLYTDSAKNLKGQIVIGTAKIKMKSKANGSISISNINVTDSDYNDTNGVGGSTNISYYEKSTINLLSSLNVDGCDIQPSFSENTTSYSCTTDKTSLKVSASAKDKKATVKGVGTVYLASGNNVVNVVVTSESGAKKTYTINVNCTAVNSNSNSNKKSNETSNKKSNENSNVSSNNNIVNTEAILEHLYINNEDIIKQNVSDYYYLYYSNNNSLDLKPVGKSNNLKIEITGNDNLKNGINLVQVKVTNSNNESTTYKVYVYKNDLVEKIENLDSIDKDSYYVTTNDDEISKKIIENLDKYSLSYTKVDNEGKVLYDLLFDESIIETNNIKPSINNIDKNSYSINLPKNTNVTLYIGDNNLNGLIYIYNEDGYLIDRVTNDNGYISFTTDGSKKITLKSVYEDKKEEKCLSKGNNLFSGILIFILGTIFGFILRSIKRKKKKRSNNI